MSFLLERTPVKISDKFFVTQTVFFFSNSQNNQVWPEFEFLIPILPKYHQDRFTQPHLRVHMHGYWKFFKLATKIHTNTYSHHEAGETIKAKTLF